LRPFRPQAQITEPNGEKDRQCTEEDKDQVARQPQPFQQARQLAAEIVEASGMPVADGDDAVCGLYVLFVRLF
jgi:hypothetical protein